MSCIQKNGSAALALAIVLFGSSAQSQSIPLNKSLHELIQSFVQLPALDRPSAERLLGTKLRLVQREIFYSYAVDNILLNDVRITHAEYVEARPEGSGRDFLRLELRGRCFSIGKMLREYPSLQLRQQPSVDSPDPEYAWVEETAWGTLAFVFGANDPQNCLRSVAMRAKSSGAPSSN